VTHIDDAAAADWSDPLRDMAIAIVRGLAEQPPWSRYGPDCDNEECFYCGTDRGVNPPHAVNCLWEAAQTCVRLVNERSHA